MFLRTHENTLLVGLLVFVPVLVFVAYLLVRYRKHIALPKLIYFALGVSLLHRIAISGFRAWFGGWCYGPRYSTGLIPWFVLLATLGVDAKRRTSQSQTDSKQRFLARAEWAAGAMRFKTADWNPNPVNADNDPHGVWDWRDPQFLRGVFPERANK